MAFLAALWLPILLSAVIVFVASFILHMLLKYHHSDCVQLPHEEQTLAALRSAGLKPGYYMFPYATHKDLRSPATCEKFKQGPVGTMVVRPSGPIAMGKYMAMWFIYCLVIAFFTAYLTFHALGPGKDYLVVFRVAGAAAFMSFGLGPLANSIWKGLPWSMTLKEVFDGLIYALLIAGTFGWLWPR